MPAPVAPARFAALRHRGLPVYLVGGGMAMMGDNIEHVITYWVLWREFRSPALVGFEVVSHWLPFLLISVWVGELAQRHDPRRFVLAGQTLFIAVSATWGVLFATGTLAMWHACVLLVLHGVAGAMWGPAEQLMLHQMVGREDLPSAVRLNATARSLGILLGPVVGSALLLGLGPTWGIWVNTVFYLPLIAVVVRRRGRVTDDDAPTGTRVGLLDALAAVARTRHDTTLTAAMLLAALGAVFIGGTLATSMPQFAERLGAGSAGLAYGVLLFAHGLGGVVGGLAIEASGRVPSTVRVAVVSSALFGAAIAVFALSTSYLVAVAALVVGGVANIAATSTGQAIVQLQAPPGERGRMVGVYGVASSGLRVVSGVVLGAVATGLGLAGSLAVTGALLAVGSLATGAWVLVSRRRPAT